MIVLAAQQFFAFSCHSFMFLVFAFDPTVVFACSAKFFVRLQMSLSMYSSLFLVLSVGSITDCIHIWLPMEQMSVICTVTFCK